MRRVALLEVGLGRGYSLLVLATWLSMSTRGS